jgi:uncharacterized protein YejL (UPF0352 family)
LDEGEVMDLLVAVALVEDNAYRFRDKMPTLMAEVAELARALEGKHEHSPALELVEIGGIVLNMLTNYDSEPVQHSLAQLYVAKGRASLGLPEDEIVSVSTSTAAKADVS